MHRAAFHEVMTIDGEIPDVCMVRATQDDHEALDFLASGSNLSRRTIVALRSMGPSQRRCFIQQIESLGLTVCRLRRRDIHYDRAGVTTRERLISAVQVTIAMVFRSPFVVFQFGKRLFGRGHRSLLVMGRVERPGMRPPDAGVREPRKPFPSAPSATRRSGPDIGA